MITFTPHKGVENLVADVEAALQRAGCSGLFLLLYQEPNEEQAGMAANIPPESCIELMRDAGQQLSEEIGVDQTRN